VRAHMPMRIKLGIAGAILAAIAAMIWSGFDYGRILAGFNVGKIEEERKSMQSELIRLTEENGVLAKQHVELSNEAKIAMGAKETLSSQLVGLQTEVTQLREEVSFFQKLTAGTVKDGALAVQKLQVQREPDGNSWRVRALVTQGGSGNSEFKGALQLAVNVTIEGKRVNINLPEEQKETADSLKLTFKNYQRVEAVFRVPPGGNVKSVQAKIIERGNPSSRAELTVDL
jgi:hypothetical protein